MYPKICDHKFCFFRYSNEEIKYETIQKGGYMKLKSVMASGTLAVSMAFSQGVIAGTLEDVQAEGALKCGISDNLPGFSTLNDKGEWVGFDTDYCRAFAAAVLGDKDKVDYKPIAFNQSFTALQSGEVDVLSRSV